MPGIGPDYSKLSQDLAPYQEWYNTGGIPGVSVDPNYTAAAMQLGYIPNPFAPAGTEGQAQMRFLSTLKNIMDQQLGGPNGRAMQIAPSNPIASAPGSISQYLMAAAALLQSPQSKMLLPGDQAAMFQNGYTFDPINANGSPSALQQLLATGRGTGNSSAPGTALPGNSNGGQPSVTVTPAPPISGQTRDNATSDYPGRQPALPSPTNGGAPTPGASNQSNISNALAAQDQSNSAATTGASGGGPPPPLVAAWNSYLNSRSAGALDAQSKELDFWTNPVFQGFANWVQNSLGQPGGAVR